MGEHPSSIGMARADARAPPPTSCVESRSPERTHIASPGVIVIHVRRSVRAQSVLARPDVSRRDTRFTSAIKFSPCAEACSP